MKYNFVVQNKKYCNSSIDRPYVTLEHPYQKIPITGAKYESYYNDLSGWCLDSDFSLLDWKRIIKESYNSDQGSVSDKQLEEEEFSVYKILETIRHEIFYIQVRNHKLEPNEKMWFRLRLKTGNPPYSDDLSTFHKYRLKLKNELFYNYQVVGPSDVLYRFIERIVNQKESLVAKSKLSCYDPEMKEKYNRTGELCETILNQAGFSTTNKIDLPCIKYTKYGLWQIHLYPYKLNVLFQFYSEKNISLNGNCPEVLEYIPIKEYLLEFDNLLVHFKKWLKYMLSICMDYFLDRKYRYRIYKWSSFGKDNINIEEDGFSLSFSAKRHYKLLEYIPSLIILIAVLKIAFYVHEINIVHYINLIFPKTFSILSNLKHEFANLFKTHTTLTFVYIVFIIIAMGSLREGLNYLKRIFFNSKIPIWLRGLIKSKAP